MTTQTLLRVPRKKKKRYTKKLFRARIKGCFKQKGYPALDPEKNVFVFVTERK